MKSSTTRNGATKSAWWTAAVLGLAVASGAAGCDQARTAEIEPERESATADGTGDADRVAAGDRGVTRGEPAVTEEEARTPEPSATDPQVGELDDVERGHRLTLEGDQVQVTVPDEEDGSAGSSPAPAEDARG